MNAFDFFWGAPQGHATHQPSLAKLEAKPVPAAQSRPAASARPQVTVATRRAPAEQSFMRKLTVGSTR
jgi:hypothetical protein